MSKAPRHQGPQLRLCCGLLMSCPTQKGSARSLRKTLVGCSPRCRCPHICVGGRTNRPCEPPNGWNDSSTDLDQTATCQARSMKIRTALGPLAFAWAATAGLGLLPGAAQTPKPSQHDQAPVAPASLLATLQKDLK